MTTEKNNENSSFFDTISDEKFELAAVIGSATTGIGLGWVAMEGMERLVPLALDNPKVSGTMLVVAGLALMGFVGGKSTQV